MTELNQTGLDLMATWSDKNASTPLDIGDIKIMQDLRDRVAQVERELLAWTKVVGDVATIVADKHAEASLGEVQAALQEARNGLSRASEGLTAFCVHHPRR